MLYEIIRITESEDIFDGNEDVFVKFTNGDQYIATFFTYKNIETLRQKNKKIGEELYGNYFWATDMILIDNLNITTIKDVIDNLLKNDSFRSVFQKIESENEID
ncbi:hypothetical protein [Kordia sp.]|uniref:hypothetical protein n=1 Tax=Kordia sp. TaxID=1965332 RepID=UPI003D28296D